MRARRGSTSFSKREEPVGSGCATTDSGYLRANSRSRSRAMRPARSDPSTIWTASQAWGFAAKRCRASPRCRDSSSRAGPETPQAGRGYASTAAWCRQWSPPHRNSGRWWRCVTCSSTFLPGASFCAPPVPRSGMRKTWCGASPSPGRTCRSRFITTTAGCSTCRADWIPCADSPVCWGKRSRRSRWRPHSRRMACPCTDS